MLLAVRSQPIACRIRLDPVVAERRDHFAHASECRVVMRVAPAFPNTGLAVKEALGGELERLLVVYRHDGCMRGQK